jgi:prepilin peptidase CpaA
MIATVTPLAAMLVFALAMVQAALSDLTTMKIRNGLVLVLLGAFATLAPLSGFAPSEIGLSAAVAAAVLVAGFLAFAQGWIGGGDAKLAAVTALWFGPDHTPVYLVYSALFGGILTLALLQFRALIPALPNFLHNRAWIARLHARDCGVPYGVAMAIAALMVFPHTRWMTGLF